VVAIIGMLSAMAVPAFNATLRSGHRAALAADARELHKAFTRYNVDSGFLPSTDNPPERAFNLANLAPLSTSGYFDGVSALSSKLQGAQVTAYDSPNIPSPDAQFWAVLTLDNDPSVVVLLAHTDQYPTAVGTWYDGVFLIQGADIVSVSDGD